MNIWSWQAQWSSLCCAVLCLVVEVARPKPLLRGLQLIVTRCLLTRARDRRRSWPQNFPERHRPSRVAAAAHHHHPISPLRLSFSRRCSFSSIMSFARTLLRTSRALRQQSSNPIQPALGARGQTQFINSARSYATAFERTKPHVNIGTIGHVDHGKVRFVLRW